ncbi:hypothetical protein JCM8208_004383 [Rhodotorula glutinis]
MDAPSRSPKEVLHGQLDRLYDWILSWVLPSVVRTVATGAQIAFKRSMHWDALMPHERAKVVDLVLSSYVELWTRGPDDAFDWSSIKYRELLKMVGVMATSRDQANRIRYAQARHVYDAILTSVDRVEFACWGRPDAVASFARWRDELCSGSGITIVKLQRIEHVAPGVVLRFLDGAVDQFEAGLQAGRLPATSLPSGDELFILARTSTQSASRRYADFLLYLDGLDKLYRTRFGGRHVPNEAHLVQLDAALATLRHPAREGYFARLSPGLQLEALDKGRGVLFSACAELRRAGRLPDPAARIGQLYDAIAWPPVDEQGAIVGLHPSPLVGFGSPSDFAELSAHPEPQHAFPSTSYFASALVAPPSRSPPAFHQIHHHHDAFLPSSPSLSAPTSNSYSPTSSASTSSPAYFSPTMPQARSPGMPPPWLAAPGGGAHGPAPVGSAAPSAGARRSGSSRAGSGEAHDEAERVRQEESARRRR